MTQIHKFLQKVFDLSNKILPVGCIAYALAKSAKANTYVETLDKHADTLHNWIKETYDVDFKRAYQDLVLEALDALSVKRAKLAIDFTHEPFYGEYRGLYVFDVKGKRHSAELKYAVVSLIIKGKTLPLMAIPVKLGDGIAKPAIELLEYCQSIFQSIHFVLFDRGFYCAELIDYLEARQLKYCMLVPHKRGKISEYVDQTKELGKFDHELKYSKKKSTWNPQTTIVVCKGIDEFPWIFATNMRHLGRIDYILLYKKRWRIETGFRVQDEARIKSKSCNIMIRYFYFLVSCLMQLLWVVHKNLHNGIPFKKYLDTIEHLLLNEFFGIDAIT